MVVGGDARRRLRWQFQIELCQQEFLEFGGAGITLEKPKPNSNGGAGLNVSPAVRDYLDLNGTNVTDWKFVEFKDVPKGPWSLYGENNPFVRQNRVGPDLEK